MITQIRLVTTESWDNLEHSRRAHIEAALRMVCGTRMFTVPSLAGDLVAESEPDSVFILPVLIPSQQISIDVAWQEILRVLPSARIFGVLFILIPDEANFSTRLLLEPFWIETLERLYDQAIPTEFLVFEQAHPQIDWFHTVMTVTGLVRSIDNIREIQRINDAIENLEERLNHLGTEIHPTEDS